ncbi:hypothetical protein GBA63_05170 [Rubrobacter tropicus]|uniref:Uncharacterized protein n=1 Tax=Rubrobacter tropicus TaxID=2653851 RepID=A0A6G8Q6L8_9ACTN|nr:hypothetical protein [Rubrobacter tropicus]QIN82102.1 hypothetical protein GBA63_05170 [Rubrobacter tropicus]
MDFFSFKKFEPENGHPERAAGTGAGPLLALVLIGLLADVARPEEAYAGIDYGLSLLAFLGATGCVVCLTSRLAASLDPLPWTSPVAAAVRAFAPTPGVSTHGEAWPLLVALLFGPLAVLISGLGGWV